MKPNPTALDTAINPDALDPTHGVESHRRLFCPHYDDCLDVAVVHEWPSWTCTACELGFLNVRAAAGLDSYATQRHTA